MGADSHLLAGAERDVAASDTALLALRPVRSLIIGWTIAYGIGSWLLEWAYSHAGAGRPMEFLEGSKGAVYAAVWAPLLFTAVWLTDRWPVRSARDVRRLALHGAAAVAAPFVWGTAAYYICVRWVPGWEPWGVGRMYLNTANGVFYVYAVLVIICHLAKRIRSNRDSELAALRTARAATQAQLQVLAIELQPHFLFNALHAVSSLMHWDRGAAVEALRAMREMLSYAVRTASITEVSLAEELAALRMYVRIQQLRFGSRLALEWRIDASAYEAAVPHLLLQPLVENAIKYSVEALSGTRRVTVGATRVGGELSLRVADDGVGLETPERDLRARGLGRGLANARERLWHLYGARQSLTLRLGTSGHGAVVEVRLPFRSVGLETLSQAQSVVESSVSAPTVANSPVHLS